MANQHPTALSLSLTALRILRTLNILAASAIIALLIGTFLIPGFMQRVLESEGVGGSPGLSFELRAVAVLGVAAAAAMPVVLTRLEAIVRTVQEADPFVDLNARRLDAIAWAVLGLELLHSCIAAVAAHIRSSGLGIDIDWDFSPTRILTALMLFVLARVFEQGARMRAELDRTI